MNPATSLPALPAPAAAANDDIIDAVIEPEQEVRSQTSEVRGEEVTGHKSAVSAEAGAGPPPLTSESAHPPKRTAEQWREFRELVEVVSCEVRYDVLVDLAARGETNVGHLAARLAVKANKLSNHLCALKRLGLAFYQKRGKENWYEVNPDRVRYRRDAAGGGGFTLQLTTRTTGIVLPIHVPPPRPPLPAPSPARCAEPSGVQTQVQIVAE